jgi:hypothetical protein
MWNLTIASKNGVLHSACRVVSSIVANAATGANPSPASGGIGLALIAMVREDMLPQDGGGT